MNYILQFQNGKKVLLRVDFQTMVNDKANKHAMDVAAMNQLQDSLIARQFNLPQRLAILATAEHEMGPAGAASRGIGGNGYLGLSSERMPLSYLGNSPAIRGKQIHYILEDLTHLYKGTHPKAGNWLDGGSGGPTIMTGQDGFNKFWQATDPYTATLILTKSYIRPALQVKEGKERGESTIVMKKYLIK